MSASRPSSPAPAGSVSTPPAAVPPPPVERPQRVGLTRRLGVAAGLVAGLRRHDFRAALTFMRTRYAGQAWPMRLLSFAGWTLQQMFRVIPDALTDVTFARPVSRTPIWLAQGNPWANHPWKDRPQTSLAEEAEVVVVGAGFTGAGCAYHWSQCGRGRLVLLERDDPAAGASGRNEGLVVMGRYYAMVRGTVLAHLRRARPDLTEPERGTLAGQFAAVYCRAAYRNADLIEQTIRAEEFDCDYTRHGWVQARDLEGQAALDESVRLARASGFGDWTRITPAEVLEKSGMHVPCPAGFSVAAASFHPAKWVWSLLTVALRDPRVQLFTRTRVLRIEAAGAHYLVHTTRGIVRARHVINALESYTPQVHPHLHGIVRPVQTQAAFGEGGPPAMKPHVGISASWFFCGKHGNGVLVGSDATPVPDREAGRNQPSRFLTKFFCGEMKRYFGPHRFHLTHEWSGGVGFTADEYPLVGLLDGQRQYLIAGMCGSGTGVSFNAARCLVNRILGRTGEPDDYPAEYFGPTRLLDPAHHPWPTLENQDELPVRS